MQWLPRGAKIMKAKKKGGGTKTVCTREYSKQNYLF